MVRPRIFVSHSSQCTPEEGCRCRDYLLALDQHLDDLGCDPVVDKGVLSGGNEWNRKILREIKTCHGMVMLLSPHALKSYPVMEEGIVASAEHAASDGVFLILPITLPGVRRSSLPDSTLKKLNLGRLDMVDWPEGAGPGEPPEKIARSLRPLIERMGSLPYPAVTDFIAGRISDVSDAALEETAQILGVATIAYACDHSRYVVAQGLLAERPVQELGGSCAMRQALQHFLPQVKSKEHRDEIVDLVVPFARVPKKAADQLRDLGQGEGTRLALLQSGQSETPEMYVRRASETPASWVLRKAVPRNDGSSYIDGVVEEVRALLVEEVGMGFAYDDEQLRGLLVRHEAESGPFTVVLHELPDTDLVHRLLAVFPRLLYIFAHQQATAVPQLVGSATCLETLTSEQEADMVMTHRKFRR
ncbi:toll/interleukin-1 receptor domain-containing protein [Streptomyces sp. NPDC051907]|uniref:toll/interleukin-1 receptor domain-containing protein n=1 Tax=Streptomyces sp. NPDC051907 TaxID=3155284 RepID=UPI0034416346